MRRWIGSEVTMSGWRRDYYAVEGTTRGTDSTPPSKLGPLEFLDDTVEIRLDGPREAIPEPRAPRIQFVD